MNRLDHNFGLLASISSACVILIALSAAGFGAYELAFFDTLTFFGGVFLVFYIPGSLIIRSAGFVPVEGLKYSVSALAAGVVIVPLIYRFLRYLNSPDFYVISLLVVCVGAWLYLTVRRLKVHQNHPQLKLVDLLSVLGLLIFILVLLHFSHFTDILLDSTSFQFRATDMGESVYHLGLINALADTYPPPALYASGEADFASYHLNMHLQIELLVRLLGLESLLLSSFYVPLLYFTLLVLLPYVFVRDSGGTSFTGIVCAMLIFGTDFSFIPALFYDLRPGFAWTAFFQSTIWPLFTLNGILPAIIALYLCIIVVRDYFGHMSLAKLAMFAIVAYGAFGFKSSMGLQIGAAGSATGLLIAFYGKNKRLGWSLVIASFATSAVMLLDIAVLRSGVGDSIVTFSALSHFHRAIESLGIPKPSVALYIPMIIAILIAGLGVRTAGLMFLYNRISKEGSMNWDWLLVFIGLFYLCGYVVSELFFIGNTGGMNNSGWFYIQSLMASWFLVFLFLIKIQKRKRIYIASIIIIFVLATPSTIQFLQLRSKDNQLQSETNYVTFGGDELRIIEYLRQTNPDSIVLHPLNPDRPSLASNFSGRITVLSVWTSFITESQGLSERVQNVWLFFDKKSDTSERLQVLNKYRVDYVYGSTPELIFMKDIPQAELVLPGADLSLYRIRHGEPRGEFN